MSQADKERIAAIQAKMKQAKANAEKKEIEDYETLIKGPVWRTFRWLAYFVLLLSVLIVVDTFLPANKQAIKWHELQIYHGYINVDGVYFDPDGDDLQGFQTASFAVHRSVIFNEIKYVSWDSHIWQYDRDAPPIVERHYAPSWNTVFSYFPWPSIAFIIPLLVVIFKRRSPWFKFFRFVCWIVIFPSALICTFFLLI